MKFRKSLRPPKPKRPPRKTGYQGMSASVKRVLTKPYKTRKKR